MKQYCINKIKRGEKIEESKDVLSNDFNIRVGVAFNVQREESRREYNHVQLHWL